MNKFATLFVASFVFTVSSNAMHVEFDDTDLLSTFKAFETVQLNPQVSKIVSALAKLSEEDVVSKIKANVNFCDSIHQACTYLNWALKSNGKTSNLNKSECENIETVSYLIECYIDEFKREK